MGIIPSAVLIFVVLGTMMLGLATPTEAGAMGAIGAIVLAAIHHKDLSSTGHKMLLAGIAAVGIAVIVGMLARRRQAVQARLAVVYLAVVWLCLEAVRIPDLRDLIKQGYESTMRLSTMVVFILIGSTCFSVVFLGVYGGVWLEHHLTSIPGGVWGFLIFINLFIFFLAFFLDFFEIAFIILPMVAPIAQKVLAPVVGADAALIWFGVMLCVNMQTSFLHPPFGFALFYLRGVAPKEVKSSDIYWGALPWIGLQVDHGGDRDRLPRHGDGAARQALERRPQQGQDRGTGNRAAAAGFRSSKSNSERRPRQAGATERAPPRRSGLIPLRYQQTSN